MSRDDVEHQFMEVMAQLPPDEQAAFETLIQWLAERPKNAEQLSQEKIEQLLQEVRLEQIRRRLGGKVGTILPFAKPGQNDD